MLALRGHWKVFGYYHFTFDWNYGQVKWDIMGLEGGKVLHKRWKESRHVYPIPSVDKSPEMGLSYGFNITLGIHITLQNYICLSRVV